jgi:pilus assembly protein CpaE
MSLAVDETMFADEPAFEERVAFAAFVADPDTQAAAVELAGRQGWPAGEVQQGGLAAALRQLGVVATPELMLVDLSDVADPAEAVLGLQELTGGSKVIALSTHNDVGMFRRVLDAGAADYLVKPVTAEQLADAVRRVAEAGSRAGTAPARLGRCVAVVGARGGTGASTLAGNLAWLVASERERRTALLDLDLQFGSQALAFDATPSAGLREALEDPDRVDEMFLDYTGVQLDQRFTLFAAEESVDDTPKVPGTSVAQLLGKLRAGWEFTVVDLPRGLVGEQPDLLEQVTDLVIVTDLSLAGLRDCNRLIRLARPQAGKLRLRIAANRMGKQIPGQVQPGEFAKELEAELSAQLTFDPDALAKAAMAGKPLAASAPKAKLLKDVRALLVDLIGDARKPRKSLFGGLAKAKAKAKPAAKSA